MNPWTPLIAATVGWGSSAVLTRAIVTRGVDTFDLLPVRMSFAMLSLGAVILLDRRFGTLEPIAWKRGIVLGIVSMALPMSLMTLGVEDLPVSLGGLLIALVPIATIAAAHFLVDGEMFVARSLPGLLISLIGSAVLIGVGGGTIEGVGNLWRGVALSVIGVVLAGVGGALSRRYALEVTSEKLVLPQFTVATIILFAVAPVFGESGTASFGRTEWILMALSGIVGTTLPFGAFLVAASINPASRLAMTGYTVPVVAVALAVILLGETVTFSIVLGAGLILGGVYLAERGTKHVPEPGVSTAR
jgi:drug/metabolite transporter (DMT)-like permease